MDPRFRGTVVEEILPFIEKDGAAVLKRHDVTKEQYALWLFRRTYDQTGVQAAVIIVLCVGMLAMLTTTLMRNGGMTLNGETVVKLFAIAATLALILGLTAWSMRHSSNVLVQHMASMGFLHRTSAEYLDGLSARTWTAIAAFEPDIDRFLVERTLYRRAPTLTRTQENRIATLRPWRRVAGFAALGSLALLFFVGESGLSIVSGLMVTLVGLWLLLGSVQVAIAGQFEDATTGLRTFGKPARFIAIIEIIFSVAVLLAGVGGLVTSPLF